MLIALTEPAFVRKYGAGIVTILAVAGASCRFTDPTWYRSESTLEIIRVLSALGFWVMTGAVLARLTLGDIRAAWARKLRRVPNSNTSQKVQAEESPDSSE